MIIAYFHKKFMPGVNKFLIEFHSKVIRYPSIPHACGVNLVYSVKYVDYEIMEMCPLNS